MKKMFLVVTAAFVSAISLAQVSLGVHATGNIGAAKVSFQEGTEWTQKAGFGPGGGIVAQFQLGDKFALRSGINYLQHVIKINTTGIDPENGELGEIKIEAKNKFNYLQLPVYALYTRDLAEVQFFAGAGPFVNYGLSGKSKLTAHYTLPGGQPGTEELEVDAFKDEEEEGANFERLDWGVGAVAGIRFANKMFVNLGYQMGLANITKDEGNKYRTHAVQLSVGYFFR